MLVKNSKSLELGKAIDFLKSKNQLESKAISFLRNKRVLQPVFDEYKEIVEALQNTWKKEFELDEALYNTNEKYRVKANTAYAVYQSTNKDLITFLAEEKELEFHTFTEDSIANESFDWEAIEILSGYIVEV